MSDIFINKSGLSRFWNKIKIFIQNSISSKQDTLVSGTNIKTVNNNSLLGSGNVAVGSVSAQTSETDGAWTISNNGNTSSDASVSISAKVTYSTSNNGHLLTFAFTDSSGARRQYSVPKWKFVYDLEGNMLGYNPGRVIHTTASSGAPVTSYSQALSILNGDSYGQKTVFLADEWTSGRSKYAYVIMWEDDETNQTATFHTVSADVNGRPIYRIYTVTGTTWTRSAASYLATSSDIPTAVSELTNDENFQSDTDVAAAIAAIANPNESVTFNANGQLDVGGRLGAFPGTTGIFHSKDREPRNVKDFSFLITDAKGMNLDAPRDFALVTGVNLSLKGSHAAGSTTYTVANTYANRIACAVLANGGYVGQSEAWSKENQIVAVTGVKINGSNYTPSSAADDSTNPITITTATSANPDNAVTQLRVFGGIYGGFCAEYIGQCVGGAVGASLVIGQRVFSSGNVNCIVSADVYNTGNGNALLGRLHISRKNRWFMSGSGHDNSNGRSEAGAAVGQYSSIDANTIFAVGNGTSHTDRKNAFEVRADGFVIPSPNGTRYLVSVDDTGAVTSTAIT